LSLGGELTVKTICEKGKKCNLNKAATKHTALQNSLTATVISVISEGITSAIKPVESN